MPIPSTTYTEIVTHTLDHYSAELADNITNNNVLLLRLKRKGNTETVGGGVKILENLLYGENATIKWYSGLEELNIGASDVATSAYFDWKELNANVVMSGLEKAQNSGTKESVHKLVTSKIRAAEITINNAVAAALFYSNTENGGKSIGGLQHLIADIPSTGTVGGINRQEQAWWSNQMYDFSDLTITPSNTTIQSAMNQLWINTLRGKDMIDLFVADAIFFRYYLESLQANQRFMKDDTASAGFRQLEFMGGGAQVVFDANCPASHMYGLNTDYIHYRPHSDYNFVTADDKIPTNQDATIVPLFWKGNMTVSNPSLCGVITA